MMAGDREIILHWDKQLWTPVDENDEETRARHSFYKRQRVEQYEIYGKKLRTIISPEVDLGRIKDLNPSKVFMIIEDEALKSKGYFLTRLVTLSNARAVAKNKPEWSLPLADRFETGLVLAEMGIAAFLADSTHSLKDVFIGKEGISFVPGFRP